jgi:hypothetical protein
MTKRTFLLLFFILLMAGCTQNIQRIEPSAGFRVPSITYQTYFFVQGQGNKARAVFLKHPDVQVDIVFAPQQITETTATYGDALTFMYEEKGLRRVNTEIVNYKGKLLGYLLIYDDTPVKTNTIIEIQVELYEKNGKIHFIARERPDRDH